MITTDGTKHLSELSKLKFSEDELIEVTNRMSAIIDLMDKVCDFDKALNTYAPKEEAFENLRPDNPRPSNSPEDIVANSKAVRDNCFVVPKVV